MAQFSSQYEIMQNSLTKLKQLGVIYVAAHKRPKYIEWCGVKFTQRYPPQVLSVARNSEWVIVCYGDEVVVILCGLCRFILK